MPPNWESSSAIFVYRVWVFLVVSFSGHSLMESMVVYGALRPSGLAACGLIRRLHKSDTFVLAVDLPSGINTDTGEVAEGAAHADLTVTFDSYKPLHMAEASAPLCGKIVCADIGIRDEWHPEF